MLPTPHLVILDWDIIQIDGYFLKEIIPQWIGKTKSLSEICNARMGTTGLFIEDKATGITLLQQGANEGWNVSPNRQRAHIAAQRVPRHQYLRVCGVGESTHFEIRL